MFEDIDTKNQKLTEIFARVGAEYNYETVNAEFMAFREFKCTWQRSYKWADFRVSDYLEDAPEDVLESLAVALFRKIRGDDYDTSDRLREYVTADGFADKHRDTYLARTNGERIDQNILKRVMDKYNINLDNVVLYAFDGAYTHKVAGCSVLMRVIGVSDALLKEDVPENVLDFVIYHELQHLIIGYAPDRDTTEEIDDADHRFEDYESVKAWMRANSMYV